MNVPIAEAETEALRQGKRDSLAYAEKAFFPNAWIHQAGKDSEVEPEGRSRPNGSAPTCIRLQLRRVPLRQLTKLSDHSH